GNARGGRDGPGAGPRDHPAHGATREHRSGHSLRLCASRRARGGRRARDLELVRLRRPERDPRVQAHRVSGRRVVITGAGLVDGHASGVLSQLLDEAESRRLSRVCQMTVAAGRLALADAGLTGGTELALLVGTEFGDMVSTIRFVDDYLHRGIPGLSALLFPHTVMNTMAATTAIAVSAKDLSLTLNVPTVAGELAIARAAAAVRAGRIEASPARAKRGSARCSTARWRRTSRRNAR